MRPNIKNIQQIYVVRDVTEVSSSRHISEYRAGKSPKQIIWNIVKARSRNKYIKSNFPNTTLSDYEVEITTANKRYVSISVFVKRKDSTRYIISKFTVWPWGNQSTRHSPRFR